MKAKGTVFLLNKLLKINSIKVDNEELKFQFESHPSYPSLHSLTGVLNHFRVTNFAVQVPKDIETLSSLPKFFIAHYLNEKGEHFVLVNKTDDHLEIIYDEKNKEKLSADDFIKAWTGILVAVEQDEEEKKEKLKVNFSGKVFYYITAVGFLFLFFWNHPNVFQSFHFLLSILGLITGVMIIQHELGVSSAVLDKFCAGNKEKTDCDSVLNSKGAKLPGNIKYSDIGIIYFAGIIISWLFLPVIESKNFNFIIILTIAAIPFTFYSVFYQYRIVKKWCPLCLSILVILWCQVLSLFLLDVKTLSFSFDLKSILLPVLSFLTVISLWIFIYPKLKLMNEYRKLKINHFRFKNNYNIFDSLISRNPKIDTTIEDSTEIVLGNRSNEALLKIVLITNPLCGHCKNAHHAIVSLLDPNIRDLQIRIRFNVNAKDRNNLDVKIALCLLHIFHNSKENIAIQALHDAYSEMTYEDWLNKWNNGNNKNTYLEELKKEKAWCLNNNIDFTPEILINGKPFPNEYDRTDLQNFIEEIVEIEQHKSKSSKAQSENAT